MPDTPHLTPHTRPPTPYTRQPTLCTLHPTPFTRHPTPNILNPTPDLALPALAVDRGEVGLGSEVLPKVRIGITRVGSSWRWYSDYLPVEDDNRNGSAPRIPIVGGEAVNQGPFGLLGRIKGDLALPALAVDRREVGLGPEVLPCLSISGLGFRV